MYKDNINKMNECLQNSINMISNDITDIDKLIDFDLNNTIN